MRITLHLILITLDAPDLRYSANAPKGDLDRIIPTKAIIVGPFLAVLGGDCVFQSTVFTLTSALAQEYVQR